MNREEAEAYVYQFYMEKSSKQDYHAKDKDKRHPELTRELIKSRAGTPCVVVTGSKGKGSTANMISRILQTEYKVGLMTSPHISNFCERFRIDGKQITDERFAEEMTFIRKEIDEIAAHLKEDEIISPMGIQTVLALQYFEDENTEFNVLECGKGAKYDDVNNAVHSYSVITPIFLEHLRELGDTVEEIAEDKSHVIMEGQRCVYIAKQEPSVMEILLKRAAECNVKVKIYGEDFRAENIKYTESGMQFDVVLREQTVSDSKSGISIKERRFEKLAIPLLGEHQAENCALAMELCVDVIQKFKIDAARKNLMELKWDGRMEVLNRDPFILLDACITRESCRNVKKVLKELNISKVTAIIGIPDDKDYPGVVEEIASVAERIILTKSQNLHYVFTEKQEKETRIKGFQTVWTESIEKARGEALKTVKETEKSPNMNKVENEGKKSIPKAIIILGTTSIISEVKQMEWVKDKS